MSEPQPVSLTLRATFDTSSESIGLFAEPSDSFDEGGDTRAKIEVLAAIVAKSNSIASEVIRGYTKDDARRQSLYDHFAGLKEQMLNDMLEEVDRESGPGSARVKDA